MRKLKNLNGIVDRNMILKLIKKENINEIIIVRNKIVMAYHFDKISFYTYLRVYKILEKIDNNFKINIR